MQISKKKISVIDNTMQLHFDKVYILEQQNMNGKPIINNIS